MADQKSDVKNPNNGTPGQNAARGHNQGNRGKQLNPLPNNANQKKGGARKK